jgi:hypothetical protein
VAQDYVEAHFWFDLAASVPASPEQEMAARNRDRTAEKLSPAELSEVQTRAAEWLAEHSRE